MLKVAIIHYWLNGMRGGEKVLEGICEIYPEAVILTHVYEKEKCSDIINRHEIRTTMISNLPFSTSKYQSYLPLMPYALEQLDLNGFDLIISSESGPAKGVVVPPDSIHICYCHSPMRYVWDMYYEYQKNTGVIKSILMKPLIHWLKIWDFSSAGRVDYFIANSNYIKKRIKKSYRRDSNVIYPPVSINDFESSKIQGDYYLMLGQLVSYKKPDLAVEAFIENGKKLIIVGEGELKEKLKKMAKGQSNIKILGKQDFNVIKKLYSECKALIFPGIEDFGIVPLEAMASGRPVIAYNKGGVRDTVIHKRTGLLFEDQTKESLNEAIIEFEENFEYVQSDLRKHCEKFSDKRFKKEIKEFIDKKILENHYE